jgi:hypothetical protein
METIAGVEYARSVSGSLPKIRHCLFDGMATTNKTTKLNTRKKKAKKGLFR